ncbi:hypothetical protein Bca4012_006524 [Brassica carinata]
MLLWRSETYTPDQDRAVAQETEHRKGGRGEARRGEKKEEREVSDQREEAEERRRPL